MIGKNYHIHIKGSDFHYCEPKNKYIFEIDTVEVSYIMCLVLVVLQYSILNISYDINK
jgi:hypothetical protein